MKKGQKPNPTLAFLKQEIHGLSVQAVKPVLDQSPANQSGDSPGAATRLAEHNPTGDTQFGVPYAVVTGDFQKYEGQIVQVPVEVLRVEDNVRTHLVKDNDYYALVATIRDKGVLQNLISQLSPSPDELLLISGQRRFSAATEAGKRYVPTLILGQIDKRTRGRIGLVENLQREDLPPLDIGFAYVSQIAEGDTVESLAELMNCDKKNIQRYIKLTSWPEKAIKVLRENSKLFSTEFLFNKIPGPIRSSPALLTQYLIEHVEKANAEAAGTALSTRKSLAEPDTDLTRWNQAASQSLGVPVKLSGSGEKLRITIRCSGDDERKKIFDKLGIPYD